MNIDDYNDFKSLLNEVLTANAQPLDKRFHAACAALTGTLASGLYTDENLIRLSVSRADALLKALDQPE